MNTTDIYFFMYYMICLFVGIVIFDNKDYLKEIELQTDDTITDISTSGESTSETLLNVTTTMTTFANLSGVSSVLNQTHLNATMTTGAFECYENCTLKPVDTSVKFSKPFTLESNLNNKKNISQLNNPPNLNITKLPELGVNNSGELPSSGTVTTPITTATSRPLINSPVSEKYSQNLELPNGDKNKPRQDFVLW